MATSIRTEKTQRLIEVEGLRALSVVAVIFNHYFENIIPSGFLGVDIFFVISGFVITKYLTESSFKSWSEFLLQFYSRRIKRLFPALLFCVVLTSYIFIHFTTRPPSDVFRTAAFALIGASNIFLHINSTDYFSLDAKLNPFTHTWSLGVEEQFYLLFPILLGIFGFVKIGDRAKKKRILIFPILISGSLILWIILGSTSQSAQFYLLPSRIWELAIGAMCCIIKYGEKPKKFSRSDRLSNIFLVLLVLVFFVPNIWQTWLTIACVLMSAALLISIEKTQFSYQILSNKVAVAVGTISYSLYLWHWSVLVISKWTFGETIFAKILSLFVVLILALFSYFCIERPIRNINTRKNTLVIILGVLTASIFAIYVARYLPQKAVENNNLLASIFHIKDAPEWGHLECHGRVNTSKFTDPLAHCLGVGDRRTEKPNIVFVIGDSHAAQLYWMVQRATEGSKYSVKFVNLEADIPSSLMLNSPGGSGTLDYVRKVAVSGDLMLFSMHRGQFNGDRDKHISLGDRIYQNERTNNFLRAVTPYIENLKQNGVDVILSRDTPLMSVVSTSSACALQIKLFGESICKVSKEQDMHTRRRQDIAYDTLASQFDNVKVWDPAIYIYGDKKYIDVIDVNGNYVMQDWHHITQYESYFLAPYFKSFLSTFPNTKVN
jgi:peptidoglycan/LPS O-acetylase OafA/YrhL